MGQIDYEESFWTGKKSIYINGEKATKVAKNLYKTADGKEITLKGCYLSGASVTIDGEKSEIYPSLKWYEIILSVLPFLLVVIWGNSVALCKIVPIVGGLIGGLISGLFVVANVFILRAVNKLWLKILLPIVMLGATFLSCYLVALAMLSAIA